MVRIAARVYVALALAATVASTAHAELVPWEVDYKSWMADIKKSVAGNPALEQQAAKLQTQLDAAIVAGVPEEDRMRLLYDFLSAADSDPTFAGFTTKEAAATTTASTPAPTPTPSSAAAASYKTLASLMTVAVAVVGYALL